MGTPVRVEMCESPIADLGPERGTGARGLEVASSERRGGWVLWKGSGFLAHTLEPEDRALQSVHVRALGRT